MKAERNGGISAFFVAMFCYNMAANFVHPVTPAMIVRLNLNDYMFGIAFAAMMASNFLLSPFWGKMAGYIGSRNVMSICAVGYGVGQVFFGLAQNEVQFLLARIFSGGFSGGAYVAFMTYTVNCSTAENRGRNLALNATLTAVSTSFGYFIGGMIGEINIYYSVALQVATVCLLAVVFRIICIGDKQADIRSMSGKQMLRECNPLAAILQCRRFMTRMIVLLFLSAGLLNLGYIAFEQCFNYALVDRFGLSSGYNGVIKAALGVISMIANGTLCLWILRRERISPYLAGVMMVCSAAMFGVIFADSIVPFVAINVVFFAFYYVSTPLFQDRAAALGQGADSNLVMGSFNAVKSFGSIFGSALAGVLYEVNMRLPFVFGFVAIAAATAVLLLFIREEKRTVN